MDTQKERAAYQKISKRLAALQKKHDAIQKELLKLEKFAKQHGLLFVQRYSDSLPEVLNPDLYTEVTTVEYGRTFTEKVFKDDHKHHEWRKGDSIDVWIPSSLC